MIRKLLITWFGLGYLPIAPGTWGSFGAVIVFVPLALSPLGGDLPKLWAVVGALMVIAYFTGVGLGRWACEFFRSANPKRAKDPNPFVLDEVVGQWLSLLAVPFHSPASLAGVVIVQFFLFRVFDVFKPFPARRSERLPYGWGIMTDDMFAGVYANLVGQIVFRVLLAG